MRKTSKNDKHLKFVIFYKGDLIPVVRTSIGYKDEAGNEYCALPDGKFIRFGDSIEINDPPIAVSGKRLAMQIVVKEDGSTWQYQPQDNGKLLLVKVKDPIVYVSLSPTAVARSGTNSAKRGIRK